MRYIKIHIEAVLPVPPEIREEVDAVAEAGLSALRDHLYSILTTAVPGSINSSWQSMPAGWQPRRVSSIHIEEEVFPGFFHRVDREERISFVDVNDPDMPPLPPQPPRGEIQE